MELDRRLDLENNTGSGLNGTGSGFVGGVPGGYNYLLGPVLLGADVDFQGSTISSGMSGGAGPSDQRQCHHAVVRHHPRPR